MSTEIIISTIMNQSAIFFINSLLLTTFNTSILDKIKAVCQHKILWTDGFTLFPYFKLQ